MKSLIIAVKNFKIYVTWGPKDYFLLAYNSLIAE